MHFLAYATKLCIEQFFFSNFLFVLQANKLNLADLHGTIKIKFCIQWDHKYPNGATNQLFCGCKAAMRTSHVIKKIIIIHLSQQVRQAQIIF